MKKTRACKCGATVQVGNKYCQECGGKVDPTLQEYYILTRKTEEVFKNRCSREDFPKKITSRIAGACWGMAEWLYEDRDSIKHLESEDVIPDSALVALTLVRDKAEEMAKLLLDFETPKEEQTWSIF